MSTDIPDLIAGALGVSRGTAYDMMRDVLAEQPAQQQPVASLAEAIRSEPTEMIHKWRVLELVKERTQQPAQQTCNCQWDGDIQVQQCTLHEAHVDAIHEWAERAKLAEHKFKNFHRLLCERFGYSHDERDWQRDQLSLIEWIAKQVEQQAQQEPVAWMELLREARDNCKASIVEEGISAIRKEYRIDLEARLTAALNAAPQPAQQEPVKAMHIGFDWLDNKQLVATYAVPVATNLYAPDLYTSPPTLSLAQRKPLTEQEIVDLCDGRLTTWEQVRIARAIEAAHGIKEKNSD